MAPNYNLFPLHSALSHFLALLMSSPSVYARVLLGSSGSGDDWMLVDSAKILWAIGSNTDNRLNIRFYTHRKIAATERGLALGFPGSPRIRVPLPEPEITNYNPLSSRLRAEFLSDIRSCSKELRENDTLFLAFCSHGREMDGAVFIGKTLITDETTREVAWITIEDVEAALEDVPKSAKIIIWLGSCHSGFWLRSKKWTTYAAAEYNQESHSIPQSSSGHIGGSRHTLGTFTTLGKPNGVIYPYPGEESSYFTKKPSPRIHESSTMGIHRLAETTAAIVRSYPGGEDFNQTVVSSDATYPLPGFPQFTHTALNRLGLFHAGEIAQSPEMITATASVSESSSSRLDTLIRAFRVGVGSYAYPPTPSTTRLNFLIDELTRTPNDAKPELVQHAIAYHETLQFLARSLSHVGVWKKLTSSESRSNVESEAPVISGRRRDAVPLFTSSHGVAVIHELWNILGSQDFSQSQGFKWSSMALKSYAEIWVECGKPVFDGEALRRARAQVLEWIDEVGKAKPELLCPLGCTEHLLLTKAEYQALLDTDSWKEFLLGGRSPDSPQAGPILTSRESLVDISNISRSRRMLVPSKTCTF
ncbi:hypothetical protein BT96DRAFT_21791 [Gymnopus androsaceus JB14]|uniref:Peptidase C14 n=1 Tax=Gymnopus androsaceus JB14 TaxID=1447944 RepID=A0A6A4IHP2_9AGAR|nr:hypothetical protein BT96DRAFT_21791 [Gymnopus androsaceus JB14]